MATLFRIIILFALLSSCSEESEEFPSNQSLRPHYKKEADSLAFTSPGFGKIEFTFYHSMRYPYKEVKIVIEPQDSTALVHLLCDPMHYDGKKWIPNPVDTIYQITQMSYDEIIQSIRSIDFSRMINHFNTSGTDGTTYTLEYGNWQNTLKLSVWSPDFDTKERKLEGFLFTCELILNAAGLNSEEIL